MANSKKRCKQCGEYTPIADGQQHPAGFFCSSDHVMLFIKNKNEKASKKALMASKAKSNKEEKEQRKELRFRKEQLKTAGSYIKEAQAAVNKYIRMRDYGKPCISCGNLPAQKIGGTMDAGHYRSRGAASHLRFNCFNIHAQCVKCNRYGSGNAVDYRIQLIKKLGLDIVERLEHDNNPRKFTIEYLKRIKKIFNKRARIIEKRLSRDQGE